MTSQARPCPRCGKDATLDGFAGTKECQATEFEPDGVRLLEHLFWRFGKALAVRLREPFRACLDCGLAWSGLTPEELKEILERERISVGGKEIRPGIH